MKSNLIISYIRPRRSLFRGFYFSLRILSHISFYFCHFLFLSASYLFSSCFRSHFMNERIFSRRFELFVFSHSRLFCTYFTFSFSLSFPIPLLFFLSHSFFNLFLLSFPFYLTPLLPSYTALGDFFFFSCHSSSVRQNLRSLLYPSPSFFLLIRRLRRSLSIPRRSRRRFLYCICSLVFSLLL